MDAYDTSASSFAASVRPSPLIADISESSEIDFMKQTLQESVTSQDAFEDEVNVLFFVFFFNVNLFFSRNALIMVVVL